MEGWSQVEQRMAFYAGIIKRGKITIPADLAQRWRNALPRAIEEEYRRLDRGELPRSLTTAVVLGDGLEGPERTEAASEAAPSERTPGAR
jgi:hypothetical protein